jgi:hypothetical protein
MMKFKLFVSVQSNLFTTTTLITRKQRPLLTDGRNSFALSWKMRPQNSDVDGRCPSFGGGR